MPKIIVTRTLPEPVERRLRELFGAELNAGDAPMSRAELAAALQKADILVPTVTDRLDADLIRSAGPQLKLIANFGAGVDHIDLAVAREKNIFVTNTPGVLTEDTADIAMALILATPRRLSEGAQIARAGDWPGWSPTYLLGRRVAGKALGIVGMGRIGQAVARRARGFGLSVHYHKRKRLHASVEAELNATWWPELDAMLAHVDIVTLHCPHTTETDGLLSAARLRAMKPGSYLVNTARGALVDETALADALRSGHLAGAGLDVYANEPHIPDALRALPNVTLLPHISSATLEARVEMGEKVIINIRSFIDGHRLPDRVLA